jgi:hypothetical protein
MDKLNATQSKMLLFFKAKKENLTWEPFLTIFSLHVAKKIYLSQL